MPLSFSLSSNRGILFTSVSSMITKMSTSESFFVVPVVSEPPITYDVTYFSNFFRTSDLWICATRMWLRNALSMIGYDIAIASITSNFESSPRFQKSIGVITWTQNLSLIFFAVSIASIRICPMSLNCFSGMIVKMWISFFFASASDISYSSSIFFAACAGIIPIASVDLCFFKNSVLNFSISFCVLSIFAFRALSIWFDIGSCPWFDFET